MNAISQRIDTPAWGSRWLSAAVICNLLWGVTTIALPRLVMRRFTSPTCQPGIPCN